MSKTSFTTTCLGVLCAFFFHGHAFAETKSGEIDLSKAHSKETAITFSMGTKVTAQCTFYIFGAGGSSGKQDLLANAALKNTATKVMHIAYYVAFFDKEKNLIGCGRQVLEMEPGDEMTLGNCDIHVPIAELSKITSYQVVFHEAEEAIGKK